MPHINPIRPTLLAVIASAVSLTAEADVFTVGELNFEETGDGVCVVSHSAVSASDIEIPSSVEYQGRSLTVTAIGDRAFAANTSLASVRIPSTVVRIGNEAFTSCRALSAVMLPDAVTSVGRMAFYGCTALDHVSLGSGLTEIATRAFDGADALTTIFCNAATPPNAGTYIFSATTYASATLTVPEGCRELYRSTYPWSQFASTTEESEPGMRHALTLTTPAGSVTTDEAAGHGVPLLIVADDGWTVASISFNGIDITDWLGDDGWLTTPALDADSHLDVVFVSDSAGVRAASSAIPHVSAVGSTIIISGKDDSTPVTVHDPSGRMIYRGTDSTISYPVHGTALVTVGSSVFKLFIE